VAGRKFGDAEIYQRTVRSGNGVFGIGEQLEAESFLGAKLLVSVLVLTADAKDDGIFLLVVREITLEVACFDGAAAGEILGIKVQHDPFATKVAQADRLVILRIQGELRRKGPRSGSLFSCAHPT
jgi:hypothetical protein